MSDAQKKAFERYRKKNRETLNEKARRYHKMCRRHNQWREAIIAEEQAKGKIIEGKRDVFFNHKCNEVGCYD